jgi:TPR repeat protein
MHQRIQGLVPYRFPNANVQLHLVYFAQAVICDTDAKLKARFDRWLSAARLGDPDSQFNVGLAYFTAEGVERDYCKAARWFTDAAEQGVDGAQCNLGQCFQEGVAGPPNYAQALKWYGLAAAQGHIAAKACLAKLVDRAPTSSAKPTCELKTHQVCTLTACCTVFAFVVPRVLTHFARRFFVVKRIEVFRWLPCVML